MRILFLADAVFEDLPGGSRVVARELAQGLAQRGHQVTFLVAQLKPDAPADEHRGSVRIVRYGGAGQGPRFVRAGREAAARLWAEQPFDIAHTHFAYAALGPLKGIPQDVPHVRTFHGPWDEEGWVEEGADSRGVKRLKAVVRRSLRGMIERRNLHASQRVTVLSDVFRSLVIEKYHVRAGRISLIPGGVDSTRFQPTEDREATRRALGLPAGRRVLLSVRRLAARMGLDNLIQAMPAVIARYPEALLLIGGKGPEQERLERLIGEQNLQNHVQLLGFIPDDRLADYYGAADAFVLPTLALEGFGLVTVEALACGTPVIGTPIGATPEILGGLDKRLIAPGTAPADLAERLLSFLGDGWAAALTAERLRRFVLDRYTWDRHIDAVEALYTDALAHRKI